MPSYAKFLKEAISNKRKWEDGETVKLNEECSAILQNKLPPKLKDPGSFSNPCTIGESNFDKALYDLDMEEDTNTLLILGRPFLATSKALIDVSKDEHKEALCQLYLLSKQDAKARLLRCILLLQEFDLEIRDRKGSENTVADHLSQLDTGYMEDMNDFPLRDEFPDKHLYAINAKGEPWFADFANFLAGNAIPSQLTYQQKKKFFSDVKYYQWDDPHLYKHCGDGMVRRCVPEEEMHSILSFSHDREVGGHHGTSRTATKVLQSGFYWPSLFKDAPVYVSTCDQCQRLDNILRRNEMPLSSILVCEIFDVWGIDFMGPFPKSYKNAYMLVVDYVNMWVEAISSPTNDFRVVLKFLKKFIFTCYGTPRAIISDGGKYFCNKQFEALLKKFGVTHRITTLTTHKLVISRGF
ncbi:UNVERIFIED_CONTAM: putative mitochondrial protein [Sesamum radiatum]|uniref:Mitochondrial protein n=1 Tax=Sesamum radiatum TaxID=300843 RepID=A0AAW2TIA6_SESRA